MTETTDKSLRFINPSTSDTVAHHCCVKCGVGMSCERREQYLDGKGPYCIRCRDELTKPMRPAGVGALKAFINVIHGRESTAPVRAIHLRLINDGIQVCEDNRVLATFAQSGTRIEGVPTGFSPKVTVCEKLTEEKP